MENHLVPHLPNVSTNRILHTRIMRSCSSCTSRRWNSVAALNIVLPALGPRQGPGAAGWGRSIKFPFHPSRKVQSTRSLVGRDVMWEAALLYCYWGGAEQSARRGFTTDNLRLTLMNSILYELCFLIVL